jgi:predicted  nucleic acid-binding Zn-ribbon protein
MLVLRHASERVADANVRALLPRRWHKRDFVVLPLFALWLALLAFDSRFSHPGAAPAQPATLAREVRDFARRLLDKARVEGLPKTGEAARELERLAQRGIDAKTAEKAFQQELADARQKIAATAAAAGQEAVGAAHSQRQLEDLKSELQTARDWLAAAGSATQSADEVLGRLSELRKQGEWRQDQGGKELSRDEIGAFLDKLDKRVTAELDRRALQQTERHLKQLAQRGQEGDGGTRPGSGAKAKPDDTLAQIPEGQPSAPGTKPGTASGNTAPLPSYTVGEQSSVKGTTGEGASSSIFLKGKPTAGKSAVAQDEVIANYQRRAEAELNNEQVPGELKGAIRSYFLSLEESK